MNALISNIAKRNVIRIQIVQNAALTAFVVQRVSVPAEKTLETYAISIQSAKPIIVRKTILQKTGLKIK